MIHRIESRSDQPVAESATHGDAEAISVRRCEVHRDLAPPLGDRKVAPLDVLGILYTSGTTSRPKGVMITHAAYAYAGAVVSAAIRLSPDDRFLTVLPLFHGNAQYYSVMSCLVTGATVVLTERFSARCVRTRACTTGKSNGLVT